MSIAWLLTLLLAGTPSGFEATGANYQMVVGSAGELLSLRVGASEALDTMALGGGGALLDPLPVVLDRFQREATIVTARGVDAVITYHGGPETLAIHALNASARPRFYRLAFGPEWQVEAQRASAPWGAAVTLARAAPSTGSTVAGRAWTVPLAPWGAADLELRFERPASTRTEAESLWAEPRTLTPGRYVLPAAPPNVDPTGAWLNLPLVLVNDTDQDRVVRVTVALGEARVSESVTLSARRAHGYDARLPAPRPAALAVEVKLSSERAESVRRFTLAFAPERWAEASGLLRPLPAGLPLRPVLVAAPGLPAGWQSARLTDGAAEHGTASWPTRGSESALLALGVEPSAELDPTKLGLASAILGDDWLPSAWAFLGQRGAKRYGLLVGPGRPLDLARLSAAAQGVAAWGPPWPERTDRPMLLGQAVAPGQPVFRPRLEAGEQWIYTAPADLAQRHFETAATAWLVARLRAAAAAAGAAPGAGPRP